MDEQAAQDLSAAELDRIGDRVARALASRGVMPYHALQYRLCEVGQNRVDARGLRRALRELANNRRPRRGRARAGPAEPCRGLYVTLDASAAEAEAYVETATEQLQSIAPLYDAPQLLDLTRLITSQLPGRIRHDEAKTRHRVNLGGEVDIITADAVLRLRPRGRRAVWLWATHEPDVLMPDDVRLWQFLLESARADARAVVVARAIAPGTFPLFKAVGVMGIQYYATLRSRTAPNALERERDALGWAHLRAVTELADHPFLAVIVRTALDELVVDAAATARRLHAIDAAGHRGFDRPETLTIASLIEWWEASELAFPEQARRGWRKWAAWDSYRRQGRSTRSAQMVDTRAASGLSTPTPPDESTERHTGFGRDTRRIPIGFRIR